MISAQEALKLAVSEELSTDKRAVYNKITSHIDREIKSNVIVNKILREYREGGWKIEEKPNIKAYLFTIDPSSTSDEKIKKILDGEE